ncbi:EmrB/QacA subfamily drug resistance transporter [Agromyces flavus]|uniref:Drug resistance transporter, EmrB/QacA subfamily n=1 Tax=Agromyces flavus TaxID=589382 RepID=A0A1H1Z504_9MICO|nr:MFS transporter [Agromyces flavus]MCP2366930.1 EmrB/QacA subfamily drug resistance transporter [Agromyces flavus]SDT28784.1 drug resistance transporter, EmrB/QacA subfamily [Agromyces flavus]
MTADTDRFHRLRWWGLAAISLGVALIIMDATIVAVATPNIVSALDLTTTQVQWIQEVYTLVFAALLMVWGTMSDRIGRRRLLVIGLVIFVGASILCAFAPNGTWLIAARAIQGVGGSMILPTTLALLNATFRGAERGIAFAVWGSTIGSMAAVGPVLGGWLTTAFSWHWAFWINLPFGILVIIGVLACVAESRQRETGRFTDWVGAAASVLGFGMLVFALIEGRSYGWWEATDSAPVSLGGFSIIPVLFVLAVIVLGALVLRERSRVAAGRSVLLDVTLFRIPTFANGNVTALTVSLGEFGLILSLPLWFQYVLGMDALQAGLALLPLAVGSFVASGAVRPLSRYLSPVRMVRLGIALEIISLAVMAILIRPDSTAWVTGVPLFFYGIGVGFATAQLTQLILVDVPLDKSGQASSTQSTARQVGSALGIAILGTALFSTLRAGTEARLADQIAAEPGVAKLVDGVSDSAGALIAGLAGNPATAAIADAAREALTQGVSVAAWIAVGALCVGLLTTIPLGRRAAHEPARSSAHSDVSGAAKGGSADGVAP